jgi:hypothetical protein
MRVLAVVVVVERLVRDSWVIGWAEIHTPLSVSKSKSIAVLSIDVSTMLLSSPVTELGVGTVDTVGVGISGIPSSSSTFAGI